uniref:Uncharacterized protein n=1 Tax=Rhizophora mucronata TaxID=61149 RepID=A0A2P2IZD6_RHIMU
MKDKHAKFKWDLCFLSGGSMDEEPNGINLFVYPKNNTSTSCYSSQIIV